MPAGGVLAGLILDSSALVLEELKGLELSRDCSGEAGMYGEISYVISGSSEDVIRR